MSDGELDRPVARFFAREIEALEELLAGAGREPTSEHVHRLRIATRRLRAVLDLLRAPGNTVEVKALRRALRRLGRILGRRRELDIARRDAERYRLRPRGLRRARREAKAAVEQALGSTEVGLLPARLRAVHEALREDRVAPKARAIERRLAELAARARRPLERRRDLHALRIALKKSRYTLEALGRPVEPLAEIQDRLGEAHDLEVLERIVGSRARLRRDHASLREEARRLAGPALRFAEEELRAAARELMHTGG